MVGLSWLQDALSSMINDYLYQPLALRLQVIKSTDMSNIIKLVFTFPSNLIPMVIRERVQTSLAKPSKISLLMSNMRLKRDYTSRFLIKPKNNTLFLTLPWALNVHTLSTMSPQSTVIQTFSTLPSPLALRLFARMIKLPFLIPLICPWFSKTSTWNCPPSFPRMPISMALVKLLLLSDVPL